MDRRHFLKEANMTLWHDRLHHWHEESVLYFLSLNSTELQLHIYKKLWWQSLQLTDDQTEQQNEGGTSGQHMNKVLSRDYYSSSLLLPRSSKLWKLWWWKTQAAPDFTSNAALCLQNCVYQQLNKFLSAIAVCIVCTQGWATYDKELQSRLPGCCGVGFLGFDNNFDIVIRQPGLQLFGVLLSLHLPVGSSFLEEQIKRGERRRGRSWGRRKNKRCKKTKLLWICKVYDWKRIYIYVQDSTISGSRSFRRIYWPFPSVLFWKNNSHVYKSTSGMTHGETLPAAPRSEKLVFTGLVSVFCPPTSLYTRTHTRTHSKIKTACVSLLPA